MPPTNSRSSSLHLMSFGRSILSFNRGQVHSMDNNHEPSTQEVELESFQKLISDRFHELSAVAIDDLLSLEWIRKLLAAFILCQDQFREILSRKGVQVSKPPLDRLVAEFFERSVKALDICNATRDGIERIRQWEKHLQIVQCALDSQKRATAGEGQFRRARKALLDLSLAMLDDKDSGSVFSNRNRSFGHHNVSKDHNHHRPAGHSRSLSWSVSHNWSAAKQLQSISNNLIPPRGNDIAATEGLASLVYSMSFVLMFVLWVLVAAIPCQDRGLHINFSMPRHYLWATPIMLLHERIMEESKKRERRNSTNGLLKEIYLIDKCAYHMTDLIDSVQFPLTEELKAEVAEGAQELAVVCELLSNELNPLEHQVREMFRTIMNVGTQSLETLGKFNNAE